MAKIKLIVGDDDTFAELIDKALASTSKNESAKDFCYTLGFHNGVSGYTYQTLPVEL